MRKLYALIIAVILIVADSFTGINAQTITIDGTSNFTASSVYGPMVTNTGVRSNRHAYIYSSSLLSGLDNGATITSLSFERNATTSTVPAGASFKIYLNTTTANDWGSASLDWTTAISGATLVYDADPTSIIGNSGGWKEFVLSTPFVFNGGNLVVVVEYIQPAGPSTAINWIYNSSSGQPAYTANQTKYINNTSLTPGATLTSSDERHPNLQIIYTPAPPCSGTPAPGNTLSTATQVCDGLSFTLSVQNATPGSGLIYQWQSSADGTSFSDISAATTSTLTTTQTASTYYQLLVTCSGSTGTSIPILVNQDFLTPTTSIESFDNFLPNSCWREAQGTLAVTSTLTGTTSSWTTDDFGNVTTPDNPSARLNITGTLSDEWLITPTYDLGTAGNLQLEFDLALTPLSGTTATTLGSDDKFVVLISTDNGTTWSTANILRAWDATTPISNTGEHIVIDLSTYTGKVKFAFYGESTTSNASTNVYVDNFKIAEIPSCGPPTGATVMNISFNNADVSWTAPVPAPSSYEIYYSTSNTAPTSSTTPSVTGITSIPYNITGLTGNTTYYVWVRSNCGSATSPWTSIVASFTTLCDPISAPTASAENFNTYLPSVCWNEAAGMLGTPTNFTSTTSSSWIHDEFINVGTTNNSARINITGTASDEWLITPSYDLGAGGNLQLEFDLALTAGGTSLPGVLGPDDKFVVLISTDNGITWTSANVLREWNAGTTISHTGEHIIINLSGYTGVVKFAFYSESTQTNSSNDVFIDNFEIKTIPTCNAPGSIHFTNVTNTSATVTWNVPIPAPASYDLYYNTASTAPTGGTTPTVSGLTANNYNLTGLTASTTYYVWVRSNCGGAGLSDWSVLPGQLTTDCVPIVTPTASPETFTTFLPNSCWREAEGLLGNPTTFTAVSVSAWLSDDFANVTSPVNDAANLSISGISTYDWLITPTYDLGTGGNLQLEFNLALTTSNGTAATTLPVDDKFIVLVSTDNGATWTSANILRQWDNNSTISNTGEHVIIDLSAYTGLVKFAFYGESTVANSTVEIFVDDIEIKTIPSCPAVGAITISNVTINSATATWVAASPAPTDYQVYFSTSSTDPSAGATPSATGINALTYDLTGLTSNTTYYVWVRSNCAGTTSPWAAIPAQFTTLCGVVSSFSENFDGVTAPALPNCWEKVGTTGSVQTQTTSNNTPPNTLYIYSSTTSNIAMVAMPKINNLGDGTHWLKFNIRANFTANGIIEIGYLTTPGDQSSFVLIDTVKAGSTTYSERTIIPGVISTSSQLLVFRHTGSPANSILIDDVRWEAMPPCTGAVGGTAVASAISYCGSGTPTITSSGFSIGAISSYQWQSSSNNTTWTDIPGATDPSGFVPASALTTTTYYRLKVTCSSGTAIDYSNTITITINPRPTVTVSAVSNSICSGGAGTTLTASGANTYTWSPTTGLTPTTGAVVTANPSTTTTYSVIGDDGTCVDTASVTIVVNMPPTSTAANADFNPVCIGGNVSFTSSAVFQPYSLDANCSTGFIDISTTGTDVTGTIGDDTEHSITIPSFSFNGITYTSALVGANGAIVLGATTGQISTANAALPSTANSAGNIFLAPYWDDLDIQQSLSIKTETVGNIFIIQYTNAAHNNYTTGAITFQVQLNLTTGVITYVYTDVEFGSATYDAGKSATIGIQYSNSDALMYSHNTASLVNGQCISFTPQSPAYSWTGPNGFTSNDQNPVRSNLTAADAGQYIVTFTTLNGCTSTDTVDLVVSNPSITLGTSPSVCIGVTSADLPYTATVGTPDQYSIDFDAAAEAAGFVDVTNASLPISPIAITVPGAATAATYNGTITVRNNAAGCNGTVSAPFTITVNANVTAGTVTGTTPLTAGASAQFSSNGTTGGTWSSTNTSVATVDPATGMATAVAAGTTDITYTVNSGCGSPVSSFLTLTVIPATTAGIVSGTSPLCIGQVATFTTTGTTGGTWSSTNTAVATVNATTGEVTAVAAGTTDITYTISGNSSFMTLTVSPNVSAGTITGTTPLCIGSPVTFTSNGTAGGAWSSSNTAVATVDASTGEVTGVAAGTADITYTVSSGCGSPVSTFISITVDPNVSAGTIMGTTPLCTGATSTFTTNGTAGGAWSSSNTAVATVDASTGEVTAVAAGTTDITYTVSSGCGSPASTTLSVTVNLAANAGTISGTSSLCVGATSALSTNGDAGGTWSSSNTAVATVDANTGLVTAVAAGSADIVYTISTGCGSPVTAQLTVNVNAGSSWTGVTSTDWNTASNWCGGVPVNTSDVTIPAGVPNMPTISDVANVRDLTIATGATLTITSAGRLNIHGDYENDGTMDATAGTVAFQGATAQTADALEVANLIMNGAGGVTLNGNLTITGALTLTNGHITTGDHTVTINQGASGSLSSHIITSGNGTVVANNVGANAYSIPVSADAAGYNPITLTNGQGLNYTVKVATGIIPTILNPAIAINRTWGIVPSATPASPVTIALEYQDGQANASANPTANMEVGVHNGTNWTVISQPGGIAPTGPATARMITVQSTLMGAFVLSNVGGTTAVPVIDQDITSIQLMPNVVNGRSTLRVNVRRAMKIDWVVTDMNGRQVSRFTQQLMPGQTDLSLQFGNLPNGSYLLSGYSSKGKTEVLRFVKL